VQITKTNKDARNTYLVGSIVRETSAVEEGRWLEAVKATPSEVVVGKNDLKEPHIRTDSIVFGEVLAQAGEAKEQLVGRAVSLPQALEQGMMVS
jgi:hypothetical protein